MKGFEHLDQGMRRIEVELILLALSRNGAYRGEAGLDVGLKVGNEAL